MTELTDVNRTPTALIAVVRKVSQWCALLHLAFLAGCEPTNEKNELTGEWAIQLTTESRGGRTVADRTVTGILVFDPSLPIWAEKEQIQIPAPHVSGRLFAPIRRLSENPPQDTVQTGYYRPNGGVSLSDEVVANITGPRVAFVLAPGVVGGRYEFLGRIEGDTVRGQWKMPPHPTGMTGRFVMWRAPNSAASDSARAWAGRIRTDPPSSQAVSIDTM